MSGDYTRFSFNPRKRYSGVLMQQGRVQLDSDWNEEIDIVRRRMRLLSLDNFGPLGVPYLTTPNAFLLGLIGGPPPDLSIQPGRLYVDGLLAELFAEDAATYLAQPFYPDPPPLPPGDSLAYLDVWEREVTYIEDPQLLDVALGGADTATRLQTVWQLKAQGVDQAACGMPVGDPPSAGRLTTQAVAPPTPDDPCILPPVAGYRGLENRLYRVEVQEGGPLGVARFKWSRDNGSIVSAVNAIAVSGGQTTLSVNRIGRDQVMRFRIGDWVTVTDDHRELMAEPGEMAQIVDLNEADRQIVLDRALPTGGGRPFGTTATQLSGRHTRVQRWDETAALNTLDGDGLMTTAAGPIDLEAGIQVLFSADPAGGSFRVGDYWVFWARTATAEIEILTAAPPRGIEHHYVQLGAISGLGGPAPDIDDCRPPPPPPGRGERVSCCTFTVSPGEPIQAAIDALPAAGGCVCLKSGLHLIDAPIVISRDNVTLHGESMGAVVLNRGGGALLAVAGAQEIRVHTIVFRQGEASAAPAIMIIRTESVVIDDCRIETRDRGIGLLAVSSEDLKISCTAFASPSIGAWFDTGCRDVTVADCDFNLGAGPDQVLPNIAILGRALRGPITVEANRITASAFGVVIDDDPTGQPASAAVGSRICANHIRLTGAPNLQLRSYGIDIAADASSVCDNHIEHAGGNVAAVRLCGDGCIATGNIIRCGREEAGAAIAILAGHEQDGQFLPLERLVIADNVAEGAQHGVVLMGVARSRVAGNILGRGGLPFGLGVTLNRSTDCELSANILERPLLGVLAVGGARNTIVGNRIDGGASGVGVGGEEAPTISGNRLTGLNQAGVAILGATQRCNVVENRIVRCGGLAQTAYGVSAVNVAGELHVEANEVMDIGLPAAAGGPSAGLAYGITGENILEARVEGNLVTYSDPASRNLANEDRALRMRGALETTIMTGDQRLVFGFAVQIANNRFVGPGASALVELHQQPITDTVIARFERVLFHGNFCAHLTGAAGANAIGATVSLVGRHCSISGNQVKATTPGYPSYSLHNMPGPFIGNVSHAGHSGRALQMPNPEAAFNTNA